MIQDPDNRYIEEINRHAPLQGRTVLEIGCGSGRITRDILRFTDQVVATETDEIALRKAVAQLAGAKIELLHTPAGKADLPKSSFDIVIYSLSLHHVPAEKMCDNLYHSGSLLKKNGKIVVLEPGERGSFLELKQRFGAGSGDESLEKAAAIAAMDRLQGWRKSPCYSFSIDLLFTDLDDFVSAKLPNYRQLAYKDQFKLKEYLAGCTTERGIILSSERYIRILERY